ncbi:MAG: sodium-dependent transporter [Hymenobacteraceae bacterium]|nr:sodium-dependent transporter [Hymenobacteraceae bacterium]MDX5397648.1 sodium-dependent transporter [Hymenobacteraceae bacterium]MDX5443887.1 sodium-dependent transporter [Hymenobacteraceae bacterium]MDX5513725.1 sodium-dependent transporter [Hymenobacteraceae bacterium]
MSANKESWGSRVGLILAMAGNAVGLGNFLRFPVQAAQNGGGVFIIPYLVCFLIMGIPLLWIEWSMGRFGGKFGHHSTPFIVDTMHKNRLWKYIGVFGIWTNIAVASYYCYLESWTISYVFHSVIGSFSGLDQDQIAQFFNRYVNLDKSTLGIPYEPIVFFVLCLILNTYILSQGLAKGVERVAKVGMPLLILFGIFLAYKGFTVEAGVDGAINDSSVGLNFLWTPDFSSLWNPSVWLAAAGQIFFTLSVGMGTIHCYASYVRSKDDIALNAMSAGWMNEFVEVVLGGAVLIPIAVGYLGIDKVKELVQLGGLGLGFKTLPYLFYQWGDALGAIAGVMWFGLLFFAGITSSLAMGTPWIGFLQDEFKWERKPAAWSFGLIVLILGMPTVLFFKYGVFDEYDYWAGTVSLVVFALFESILFAWIFGMKKGWREITSGADIAVPKIYKFIIKFITPLLLLWVFIGSLVTPKGGDWGKAMTGEWILDNSSIIKKIANADIKEKLASATDPAVRAAIEDQLFFVNASRALLLFVFLAIAALVYIAYQRRVKEGRI